jgi:hypothetical protein
MVKEESSPTLWPLCDDEIRAKLAFECLEEENRRLKDCPVSFSNDPSEYRGDENTLGYRQYSLRPKGFIRQNLG